MKRAEERTVEPVVSYQLSIEPVGIHATNRLCSGAHRLLSVYQCDGDEEMQIGLTQFDGLRREHETLFGRGERCAFPRLL